MNKRLRIALLALLAMLALTPSLALAWPWSRDMTNQISVKPQSGTEAIRPFPARSIPMEGTQTSLRVHDKEQAQTLSNPTPPSAASVGRGRKLFQIYCVACHGESGTGDGPVGAKLMLKPFDLTADRVQKEVAVGYIFGYLSFGGAIMPSYANDLYPSERWDVINYLRHGLKGDHAAAVGTK